MAEEQETQTARDAFKQVLRDVAAGYGHQVTATERMRAALVLAGIDGGVELGEALNFRHVINGTTPK